MILGVITMGSVGLLLAWDADPGMFPARAHDFLGAFPLAMIAIAYLVYQAAHRPAPMEFVKAILLVVAFLFWAANQWWPDLRQATLFNDMAIALFVLDVFLVILGWPASSPTRTLRRATRLHSRKSVFDRVFAARSCQERWMSRVDGNDSAEAGSL